MRQPCRSDQRADIFSYGVVLWELITQERPERGALRDFKVNTVTLVHYKTKVFSEYNRKCHYEQSGLKGHRCHMTAHLKCTLSQTSCIVIVVSRLTANAVL